jgi:cation:H+ antiporter
LHLVAFSTGMPLAVRLERLLWLYALPVLGLLVGCAAWRHYRRRLGG